ncbi:MAG: hypothetical protein IKW13_06540, partial [Thermoguttaceae bacterium]|nr:hypothetical protein [Thermoguttaceae bacterium]
MFHNDLQPFRRRRWRRALSLAALSVAASPFSFLFAQDVVNSPTTDFAPNLITDRALERTTYQQAGGYDARFDLKTDAAMVYGVSDEA